MPKIPKPFAVLLRPAGVALVWLFVCAALPLGASAQILKPWSPPGDTLAPLAASARARFQRQKGDSVGGDNYDAFGIVGGLGRKVFASLGRTHMSQARAVQATLDSLGLDVEVSTDPEMPGMVFMLVRNPFRRSSDAVGFLYWLRDDQLRMQGAGFPPSRSPVLRAWWSGQQGTPYEAGVLFQDVRGGVDRLSFAFFRMDGEGYFWTLLQYAGHGPEFGRGAQGAFTDVNLDGHPEIVAYQPVEPDSFLVLRGGVPPVVQELTYTERPEGFVLHDARQVPGTTETLRLLTTLLVQGETARAGRLMLRPAALDTVLALGWGKHHERGAFTVEYGEPNVQWPEWLEMRVVEDAGVHRWIVHFWIQDGRWVIRDLIPVKASKEKYEVVPLPDSMRTKRP